MKFLNQQIAELEQQFKDELEQFSHKMDIMNEALELDKVRSKRINIKVNLLVLTWTPYWSTSAEEYLPEFN